MTLTGFLNINKPCNMTSYDVIRILKKFTGKTKIGHGGILDRPAVGVLPVGLGNSTKLFEYFHLFSKTYVGTIVFGLSTVTDDATGALLETGDPSKLTFEQIQPLALTWLGEQSQFPPMYSSIKMQGKELYKYALSDETVNLKPRHVVFYNIEVDNLHCYSSTEESWVNTLDNIPVEVAKKLPECRFLNFSATCSSGTYMRSLARDLGDKLGSKGSLLYLNRTRVGAFKLESGFDLKTLTDQLTEGKDIQEFLDPNEVAFDLHHSLVLGNPELNTLINGRAIDVEFSRVRTNSSEVAPYNDPYSQAPALLFGLSIQEKIICTVDVVGNSAANNTIRLKLSKRI